MLEGRKAQEWLLSCYLPRPEIPCTSFPGSSDHWFLPQACDIFRNRSIIVKHFLSFNYVPDQALITGDIGIYLLSIPRQWVFVFPCEAYSFFTETAILSWCQNRLCFMPRTLQLLSYFTHYQVDIFIIICTWRDQDVSKLLKDTDSREKRLSPSLLWCLMSKCLDFDMLSFRCLLDEPLKTSSPWMYLTRAQKNVTEIQIWELSTQKQEFGEVEMKEIT